MDRPWHTKKKSVEYETGSLKKLLISHLMTGVNQISKILLYTDTVCYRFVIPDTVKPVYA
jgi:hypothetical protein